jgi:hypothetical protein
MNYVNHGSTRGLVRKFQGSEGMRNGGIYMMLVEENRKGIYFFGEEMKLSC